MRRTARAAARPAVTLLVVAWVALGAAPAPAGDALEGTVARVIDGDTFVLDSGVRIRLWGVDAVERAQHCTAADGSPYPCGEHAHHALEAIALARRVRCEPRQDTLSYGRVVAACAIAGQDLGAVLVEHGHAVDYRRFSKGAYAALEDRARARGEGIWSGRFTLPEHWRRSHGDP